MLSRQYRLPALDLTRFSGTKIHGHHLLLITKPSTLTHDRVATIISKKTLPLSVHRHQLKRLLHKTLEISVNKPPYFDLLIIIRPSPTPLTATAPELAEMMTRLKST
jgi:ribonuclease P protein component